MEINNNVVSMSVSRLLSKSFRHGQNDIWARTQVKYKNTSIVIWYLEGTTGDVVLEGSTNDNEQFSDLPLRDKSQNSNIRR